MRSLILHGDRKCFCLRESQTDGCVRNVRTLLVWFRNWYLEAEKDEIRI
jgi:hypothetical protein